MRICEVSQVGDSAQILVKFRDGSQEKVMVPVHQLGKLFAEISRCMTEFEHSYKREAARWGVS